MLQPPGGHNGHACPCQLLHQLPPLLLHVHPVQDDPVQDAGQERKGSVYSADHLTTLQVDGSVSSVIYKSVEQSIVM